MAGAPRNAAERYRSRWYAASKVMIILTCSKTWGLSTPSLITSMIDGITTILKLILSPYYYWHDYQINLVDGNIVVVSKRS